MYRSMYCSIYVTLICNDVTRYMYRDTMRYINMPNLLVFTVSYMLKNKKKSLPLKIIFHKVISLFWFTKKQEKILYYYILLYSKLKIYYNLLIICHRNNKYSFRINQYRLFLSSLLFDFLKI